MIEQTTDMIDLFEQMLLERAMQGYRPVLYISSPTDFQCSMMMLLPLKQEQRGASLSRQPALRAHC